jgi:hypothetical protein
MALGDDAVGVAGLIGKGLKPLGFGDGIGGIDRGLDVDGLGHIGEADLGDVILDPITLRLERVGVRQKAVDCVRLEPSVTQARVLHVVQMEVRIDERDPSHRQHP